MDGQKNRNKASETIDKWIIFFLTCMTILIERLEKKYDIYKSKGGYLNDRQKKVRDFIKNNQPVKLNDISNYFDGISSNTIKKDLQYLKSENVIDSIGKNKGTVYILKINK